MPALTPTISLGHGGECLLPDNGIGGELPDARFRGKALDVTVAGTLGLDEEMAVLSGADQQWSSSGSCAVVLR
jgi:hypothetical protein